MTHLSTALHSDLLSSEDCVLQPSSTLAGYLSRDELEGQISRYRSTYRDEEAKLALLQEHIDSVDDPFGRATVSGHITASGIAIHERKILMIFHPFLKKWLQPGGHVELGETPLQAAKREVLEETGMHGIAHAWHGQHVMPLDIDIHRIPANPSKKEAEHLHYDFRYLLCIDHALETAEAEMDEIRWMPLEEVDSVALQSLIVKLDRQGLL